MKKLFIIFAFLAFATACGDDKAAVPDPSGDEEGGDKKDPDPTEWSWSMAADSAVYILVDQFLDVNRGTFWGSAKDVRGNSWNLYWQQAHAIDVLVYSYERIHESDPIRANRYSNYFKLCFENKANNWAGDRGSTGFLNEFTDDMAWVALTMLHMTEATGDMKYYEMAIRIYNEHMLPRAWEDAKGWGLPWKSDDRGRNSCTNTPAIIIACKLYEATGNQDYLDQAKKMYNLMLNGTVDANGAVGEPPLTYTQGTWMEASRLLYHITKDASYMINAERAATFTMSGGRCTNKAGFLRNENAGTYDENNSIFKAVLIPYMVNLANDEATSPSVRTLIKNFLKKHAESLWWHNVDRSVYPKMFFNHEWDSMYSIEGNPGSLGAQASGAELLEGMTRLDFE